MSLKVCVMCGAKAVRVHLDLGPQPLCNRFLEDPNASEFRHPFVVGQCNVCGVVQQVDPVLPAELKPQVDWLTNTEPEAHLDDLVDKLAKLTGINTESKIAGLSFKEDSTLARFNRIGLQNTWRIDPKSDLGISDPLANVESVVDRFTPEAANRLVEKYDLCDMVIARHLIEHALDVHVFMEAAKTLLRPGGYVVFEIPDCMKSMEHCDYTTFWEEHVLYYTPDTFSACFQYGGFRLVEMICAPYPLEDSYIGIAQVDTSLKTAAPSEAILNKELKRFERFFTQMGKTKVRVYSYLKQIREEHGAVALFGAAHMGATFINLLGLEGVIDFVVDDNPNKKGLYMPGSRLPVFGSEALLEHNVKLCLLTLAPASEEKVLEKHSAYLERGGKFASIFPRNDRALEVLKA